MALTTRDLYLILRARDEASRVLRTVSGELLRTGVAAQVAQARANAAMLRSRAEQLRLAGATQATVGHVLAQARAWDRHAESLIRAAQRQQHLANIMMQSGIALQTAGVGLAFAGAAIGFFLVSSAKSAMEYQRQVALTQTQVDGFKASLKDLAQIGRDVANEIAVPFERLQPALFDIFSSTNANLEQSKLLLTSFAKAAVAGQVDIQAASRATISIMNAFNIPLEKVNDVLDVQFQLVRKGVGTYAEFAEHIGNSIPAAARAGQSIQTLAAMLAFLTRNGLSAAMASTSAARALEAMSHPKTIDRLEQLGIKAKDAKGNFLPLVDVLQSLRTKLMQLPPTERVEALVELLKGAGGTIQARRFLEQVLLRPGELEEFSGFLKDMENASGEFSKAYNKMADTAAARTELLRNRWKVLKDLVGEDLIPFLVTLMGVVSELLKKFNNLPDGTRRVIVLLTGLAAIAAIVGGTFLVLVGVLAAAVGAIIAAGTAMFILAGIAIGIVTGITAIGVAFGIAWAKSEMFRAKIMEIIDRLKIFRDEAAVVLAPIIQAIKEEFIPKIQEAARILEDFGETVLEKVKQTIEELTTALQKLREWWQANEEDIKPLISALGQLAKWALVITGVFGMSGMSGAFQIATSMIVGLVAALTLVFGWLRNVAQGAVFVKNNWTALLGIIPQLALTVRNTVASVISAIADLIGRIRGFTGSFGAALVDAGRNLIQGLINGIADRAGALLQRARNLAQDVKNAFTGIFSFGSPSRLMIQYGRWTVEGMTQGIKRATSGLLDQARRTAEAAKIKMVDPEFNRGRVGVVQGQEPRPAPGAGSSKFFDQKFYISTQEIDPRVHSAQLGWELLARI